MPLTMKHYAFTVQILGDGTTRDAAWNDALASVKQAGIKDTLVDESYLMTEELMQEECLECGDYLPPGTGSHCDTTKQEE